MKKTFLTMAILLMSTVTALAQQGEEGTFTLQPKVGMNISSLSDADKSIVDWAFGVEGEYMLTDNFSMAAAIVMSNQGAKYNETDTYVKYTADLDYVNVPITANYYVLPGLAIKAGIQSGFKVRAKMKTDGGTIDMDAFYRQYNRLTNEDVKISKVDLAIPVGLSYEFKNFVLDARYNIGLIKIENIGDAFYNRVFQLTLGYKFNLDI